MKIIIVSTSLDNHMRLHFTSIPLLNILNYTYPTINPSIIKQVEME